jgi:geranylgeranyl pyrophosphate synthase
MEKVIQFFQEIRMNIEEVRSQVMSLPEVAAWPEMAQIFERSVVQPNQVWEWPYRACKAVGGDESLAAPSAAAILCMILSILLVDDMLDQDPRGWHLKYGDAITANISFAFQSVAFRVISKTPADGERRAAAMESLAQMGLTMAYGQDLDARNLSGEENYWKVVRAKSSSYFGTAMHLGAIFGKADIETARRLQKLGALTGEVIQIHDDIKDALETPANPDWKQKRNNLLFLYAQTADHPDRERFQTLRSQADDPQALRSAQQILVRCGAVSYGMYALCERHQASLKLIEGTELADPEPLRAVAVKYVLPLVIILKSLGVRIPPELKME